MDKETRVIFKILSLLLQYPKEGIASFDVPLNGISPSEEKKALENFWHGHRGAPLLQLQEEYTRIFDLDPSMSLNLTHHHPQVHSRGKLLIQLQQHYREAGWENLPGELPDYLPLVLEFMSVCPAAHRQWIAGEYGEILDSLASRVERARSPYAPLVTAASRLFSQFARETKEE